MLARIVLAVFAAGLAATASAQPDPNKVIRAVFPNPDRRLTDGALVRVTLSAETPQRLLTVPQQAVQRDLQGFFVLVVGPDSKVEVRRVQTAQGPRGLAVVTAGLDDGEQVIVEGANKVRPGIVVDAAPVGD